MRVTPAGVTLVVVGETTLVLHLLTPEKVGLPGSELPRSRSVMTSRCKQWFAAALRSVLWNEM